MQYKIYNEDEELMRVVGRKEEAQAMCALRNNWTYKAVQNAPKPQYTFEEALF
jgi:uncharacterized protein (DUF2225 family)